ncbi:MULTISPECIES: DNA cytosine methyltransferase [Comamonadaceae]|jgi:DNA (cytosine-5)-methyltransferase 1|uniref:DNA cytosine methyltransferase n=1 Tax=Comamonadaceae TaxID=80864 RepID=UPI00034E5C50|nr:MULTISPECIES: DNA cytosine methyltransferase [Comamonadaceae]EPD41150.1 DNA (cytosine-5-)-methyltransferase [Delftia acidovorans CCUG 15835]KEH09671.1 modification methylase [Delftia tsuruhatensis]MDH0422484.1 DNA cytosine methyltransferase [Delftia tsuruhatensis]MDR0212478.1 DNA cytosine methyltransferase [Comamonas sp.]QFS65833.1 DNA cytosine methyltransferase [Delftia tsuruhatensis]
MLTPQFLLPLAAKLVIDLFAGGGGASTGIEQAIGRPVDVAINHDADAIGMHEVNHPQTRHYRSDIREVDPLAVTKGELVGLLHASPDCTHHSQALGGQPRNGEIRSLAWIVIRWAGKTKPDVITLENVEQMMQWSPLIAKRDPATGRVITLDRITDPATGKATFRVADPGEVVPRGNQFLVPDPKHKGRNWRHFIQALRDLGYKVEWRVICNATLGSSSTRTRLYLIARRDGLPIVWPAQTHWKNPKAGQKPFRQAAECIDWSIPGQSIFGRKKELAPATMRRIAHGLDKFVLNSPQPFIVNMAHGGKIEMLDRPMSTIATEKGGCRALVSPTLIQMGYGEAKGQAPRVLDLSQPLGTAVAGGIKHAVSSTYLVQAGHGEGKDGGKRWSHGANDIRGPLGTVTASGGGQSLASAFMVQANGGFNSTPARDLRDPVSTVTTSGSQQQLIAAHLCTLRRNSVGRDMREPVPTVTARAEHHALIQYHLSPEQEAGALRCAAFLMRYHASGGQWADLRDPMTTITTRDRLALVTVWLKGEPWVIVDITLRMLVPRELYNAQDFPPGYVIDRTASGKPLTKTAQVRMVGNSVSPVPMRLIVAANYSETSSSAMRHAA